MKTTVSNKVSLRYKKIESNIRKKLALKRRVLPDKVGLDEICQYLVNKHESISSSTWRQYRSAILHVYEYNDTNRPYLDILRRIPGGGKRPQKPLYGAEYKLKNFPEKMFSGVLNYLRENKTKTADPLRLFLTVGIETGLRPVEWSDAKIVENNGKKCLKIRNAKHTNGRANGEFRHLNLSKTPEGLVRLIEAQVQIFDAMREQAYVAFQEGRVDDPITEYEREFNVFYSKLRRRLFVVTRKLWPDLQRYPTLYSLRHQFIANAKAQGFSLEEIAAMCGHASSETNAVHYGKKRFGYSGAIAVVHSICL